MDTQMLDQIVVTICAWRASEITAQAGFFESPSLLCQRATWLYVVLQMTCTDKLAPKPEQSTSEWPCPVSRHPNQNTSSKTISTRSLECTHIARPSILPYHSSLSMVRTPSPRNNLRSGARGIYHHGLIVVRKRLLAIEHFRGNLLVVVPVYFATVDFVCLFRFV
ncbi:hypothetical protein BJX65DRAFT_48635 [Aspergillus insuetus]